MALNVLCVSMKMFVNSTIVITEKIEHVVVLCVQELFLPKTLVSCFVLRLFVKTEIQ